MSPGMKLGWVRFVQPMDLPGGGGKNHVSAKDYDIELVAPGVVKFTYKRPDANRKKMAEEGQPSKQLTQYVPLAQITHFEEYVEPVAKPGGIDSKPALEARQKPPVKKPAVSDIMVPGK